MVECVRSYGCLTCFVLLFSGPMVVSPVSLDLFYCCTSFAVLLSYMVGGWIASWASLLYYVLLYCCKWMGRSLRCCCVFLSCIHGFVSFVFLFSPAIYADPALALFRVPLVNNNPVWRCPQCGVEQHFSGSIRSDVGKKKTCSALIDNDHPVRNQSVLWCI